MNAPQRQSPLPSTRPRPARPAASLALADVDSRERWIAIARAERSRYLAGLCTRLTRRVLNSITAQRAAPMGPAHHA